MSKSKTFINMEENSDEPVIVRGAAGKAPASLSQMIDDEADCEGSACAFCGLLSCRCAYDIDAQEDDELVEEVEDDSATTRKRNSRFEYDEGVEEPDLAAYFEQFELTEQQQIAMCRTYANYLSQKVRSKYGKGAWKKSGERGDSHSGGAKKPGWKRIKVRPLVLEDEQE